MKFKNFLLSIRIFLVNFLLARYLCSGSAFNEKVASGQQCGLDTISGNPPEIHMSPGFISGVTSYVGPHVCTSSGACQNTPLICSNSSCCLSSFNATNIGAISLPASLSNLYSHCGCYDPKRKTCEPIKTFRLDFDTCNQYDGVRVSGKLELAQASMLDQSCKENSASVDLDFNKDNGDLRIRIKSQLCLLKPKRNGRQDVVDNAVDTVKQAADTVIKTGCQNWKLISAAKDLKFGKLRELCCQPKTSTINFTDFWETGKFYTDPSKIAKCDNNLVSNTVSMSPSFIPIGGIANFGNSGVCGYHGVCQDSISNCEGTNCCLVSVNGNSSAGSCDCLSGNNGNCLLDHKTFRVGHTACTKKGEVVQGKLTVRIPSAESNNCRNGISSSWSTTSVDFENNGNGKLQIAVETRQCVLSSGVGSGFLEIEEILKAEIPIEEIEGKLKDLDYYLRPSCKEQK